MYTKLAIGAELVGDIEFQWHPSGNCTDEYMSHVNQNITWVYMKTYTSGATGDMPKELADLASSDTDRMQKRTLMFATRCVPKVLVQ